MITSGQAAAEKGRASSANPNPQIPTTGFPFCRAYAGDAVWAAIFAVQSALISDCMANQLVTSYIT